MTAFHSRAFAPAALLFVATTIAQPALAQVAVIQTQEMNQPGFSAELIEARRSEGVLSVKIRLRNTGAKAGGVKIFYNRNANAFYVQAEGKKYFILQDTEKSPLTPAWDGFGELKPKVEPKGAYTWWAKYPAPPASVKKFSFYWPLGAPFDDVPIADK